jgi:hypothetical protein
MKIIKIALLSVLAVVVLLAGTLYLLFTTAVSGNNRRPVFNK